MCLCLFTAHLECPQPWAHRWPRGWSYTSKPSKIRPLCLERLQWREERDPRDESRCLQVEGWLTRACVPGSQSSRRLCPQVNSLEEPHPAPWWIWAQRERSFSCTRVHSDASEDSGVTAVLGAQVTTAPVEATRRAGVSPSPATRGTRQEQYGCAPPPTLTPTRTCPRVMAWKESPLKGPA